MDPEPSDEPEPPVLAWDEVDELDRWAFDFDDESSQGCNQ